MDKKRKKGKTLALPLLMAAGLLLPIGLSAQDGLFQRGASDGESSRNSGLLRDGETTLSVSNQYFGNHIDTDDITNQSFGTPLGGGVLIMLAAGVGYAAAKSRKRNKKNY